MKKEYDMYNIVVVHNNECIYDPLEEEEKSKMKELKTLFFCGAIFIIILILILGVVSRL